MRTAAILIK